MLTEKTTFLVILHSYKIGFASSYSKMKKIIFLSIFFLSGLVLQAQPPIPINRALFHEKVEAEQKLLDGRDGKVDSLYRIGDNAEINAQLTNTLYKGVNDLRYWIEAEPMLAKHNDKLRFLKFTENFLKNFRDGLRLKHFKPIQFTGLFTEFSGIMHELAKGDSLNHFLENKDYYTANLYTASMYDALGSWEARKQVYKKFVQLNPDQIMATIRPYVGEPFADSLLLLAARYAPASIYTFAQNPSSPEGRLIARSTDPGVQVMAKLSNTPGSLFYFPFLDQLVSGKMQMSDISRLLGNENKKYDSVGYYQLLVNTAIDYHKRMSGPQKDTAINAFGTNSLYETLRAKAYQHFVFPINLLHDEPVSYRMRAIQPLRPQDLYYMLATSEAEIYTSSYKHSFSRMMSLLGPKPRTDSLLRMVDYDYFKKFIKMAANYARLDEFLGNMPDDSSITVMKRFVSNLEDGNSLEDAVDVADSYSSITNPKLKKRVLDYIEENEVKNSAKGNDRGVLIYSLLKTIFMSLEDSSKIDLTKEIGIPSVFEVPRQDLKDSKGRIVQQVFFYGDEDGKVFFPQFVNSFSSKDWEITPKKEWVEFKSRKGEEYVFANRPLDYDRNLDDSAQAHLNVYLSNLDMQPSIVVHRGHSYWLPGTLKRMPLDTKIVVLGSCGGYQNLAKILQGSPDAHIISSKEIGTGNINQAILNYLNDKVLDDKVLNFKTMWSNLSSRFARDPSKDVREGWENYIPPYRNLGAIFIKAYSRKMELN